MPASGHLKMAETCRACLALLPPGVLVPGGGMAVHVIMENRASGSRHA